MRIYNSKLITIRAAAQNEAVIDIDGVIGEDWFSEGNTVEKVRADIEAVAGLDADKITVNINSLGGDYFHGIGIHNVLANHKAEVIVNITGWTASAGTIIAMAGDTIRAASNIGFLIHNTWTFTMGNKVELEKLIEQLGVFDNNLVKMYAKRTGLSEAEVQALMDEDDGNGKWLTAQEAQEMGFVDEVYETVKAAACDKATAIKALNTITNKNQDMSLLNTINEKIDALLKRNEVEEVEETVEATEETTEEAVESAPESVTEEQLTEISNRVEGLEKVINDLNSKLDSAKAEAKTLSEENETLKNKVKELENDATDGIDTRGEGGKVSNEENERLYSFAKTILKK